MSSISSPASAPLPYIPPWMDQKTLAAHLSVKPSTIRTLIRPNTDGMVRC